MKRFSQIRYQFIYSHLQALVLTTITLLTILLLIRILFTPTWLTWGSVLTFMTLYVVIGFFISLYIGFKSSSDMKEKVDSISLLISQYVNGNYTSKIDLPHDRSEIAMIGQLLNALGEKLQNQVKSLQRMADEKSTITKNAYKAAVIEERQRLARDLHDSVSQQLFALTMMAEAAIKHIEDEQSLVYKQLKEVIHLGLTAQSEMRALLLHLRPVYLSGDSLAIGIQKLIGELAQKSTLTFHVEIDETLTLPDAIEEHVFRICQEALSNVLRHSEATKVSVAILKRDGKLFVSISDDGIGFQGDAQQNNKTSYGLQTMRERCEELGGTFQMRSSKNEGTNIDIRIPLNEE